MRIPDDNRRPTIPRHEQDQNPQRQTQLNQSEPAMTELHEAVISESKECDFCDNQADYDGKTVIGPWAYMCQPHFEELGVGTGTGQGQKLVTRADEG